MVEHHLAKVGVAGSNPVFRSNFAGVAELADAQDLNPAVGDYRTGSIPVLGTSFFNNKKYAPVAQLDRASDYESEGCRFDSRRAHHIIREVAQLGRALGLGPRGRRFESCLPDHSNTI